MSSAKNFPELEIVIDQGQESIISAAKDLALKIKDDWKAENLREKVFSDGITNVLIGIFQEGKKSDMVLVRIYGHGTDKIIDRQAEIDNMKLFQEKGCGPGLLATFKNGLAYPFLPGKTIKLEALSLDSLF